MIWKSQLFFTSVYWDKVYQYQTKKTEKLKIFIKINHSYIFLNV